MSKKIDRSGVIPYIIEDGQIKMLFMKPSDAKFGGDCFQIAKGKHEQDEAPLEAGLREAGEELGLFTGNILETHDLGTFLGRTRIHIVKVKDKTFFGDPCDETEKVAWMTPIMFEEFGRDLHKPAVKAAIRLIGDIENKQRLEEIEMVAEAPPENLDDYTEGEEVAKSEYPLTVWKGVNKRNPQLVIFSLRNAQGVYLSHVSGHFDHNNIFVAQKAWTTPSQRKK